MEWSTTSTLLRGLKQFSDEDAWERFVGHFRPALIAFSRHLGLAEGEAEDCAQSVLLAFAESYRSGRYESQKGTLRRWVFALARNKAIDVLRLRGRQASGQEVLETVEVEAQLEGVWDREWERAILERCLAKVRKEVRRRTYRCFEAVVLKGKEVLEVAEELEMKQGAVYVAKHRVLRRLNELKVEFEDV